MKIALMVITDGRGECLQKMLTSFVNVWGPIDNHLVVNDSADPEYARWLEMMLPEFEFIHHKERRGFCGAIQSGWAAIPDDVDFVFHVEDDFVFEREVNLLHMAMILSRNPYLAQMALLRPPVSPEEKRAGGLIQMWPDQYHDREDNGLSWIEHRLFFTTNPCLYRRSLIERGWPDAPRCEEEFGRRLMEDPDVWFAFWGRREDGPWVDHVGYERVGGGY